MDKQEVLKQTKKYRQVHSERAQKLIDEGIIVPDSTGGASSSQEVSGWVEPTEEHVKRLGYKDKKDYDQYAWLRHWWGGEEGLRDMWNYEKSLKYKDADEVSEEDRKWYNNLPNSDRKLWEHDRLKDVESEKKRLRIEAADAERLNSMYRIPKRKFYELKHHYETNGLGPLELQLQQHENLIWLRVMNKNFKTFNSEGYDRGKQDTPEGYHISLAIPSILAEDKNAQKLYDDFVRKYLANSKIEYEFEKTYINDNGTIMFDPQNKFEKDLFKLTQKATRKEGHPHISMDYWAGYA